MTTIAKKSKKSDPKKIPPPVLSDSDSDSDDDSVASVDDADAPDDHDDDDSAQCKGLDDKPCKFKVSLFLDTDLCLKHSKSSAAKLAADSFNAKITALQEKAKLAADQAAADVLAKHDANKEQLKIQKRKLREDARAKKRKLVDEFGHDFEYYRNELKKARGEIDSK